MMKNTLAMLSSLVLLASPPLLAHVTLDKNVLPADSFARVAVRVPHGCDGASTTGIRLPLPPQLRMAKPMPLAGWTLTTKTHTEGGVPSEIEWSGGSLPDTQYQEFIFLLRTPAEPDTTLFFPVIQNCEGGQSAHWTNRPTASGEPVRYPGHNVRIIEKASITD